MLCLANIELYGTMLMLLIHSILSMANRVLYMTMLILVIFQWLHKATSIHLKQSMAKTLFPDESFP